MKVQVSKLKPNPYRRMDEYPIDTEKVASLKASINETTFWDNILARPRGGFYEIAYGHHRWIALKELKVKEIDIPVRDLDDGTMIKIMANENRDTYKSNRFVTLETVRVARDFLRKEMEKGWTTSGKFTRGLFANEHAFETARGMGVGRDLILKFLGGSWKEWEVKEALGQLNDKEIVPGALDVIPHLATAQSARNALKEFKVPKSHQKTVVAMVKDEAQHNIRDAIRTVADGHKWIKKENIPVIKIPTPPSANAVGNEFLDRIGLLQESLAKVRGRLDEMDTTTRLNVITHAKLLRDNLAELIQPGPLGKRRMAE